MKWKGLYISLVILVVIFGCQFSVFGQMTSSNFQIQWDSFSSGGDDNSSSVSYQLRDSIDPTSADSQSSSTSYKLDQGYRAGVYDRVADFEIFLQSRSTQVSAISVASTTVTVSTATGFSVGDMVALVENEGAAQVTAIAKITAISDPDITVDEWRYSTILPSVNGSEDYLYSLDGSAILLAEPQRNSLSTGIIGWEVSADVADGYSIYIYEDQDFTNGTDTIDDVSDGAVSVGSSEYGARSSDTSLTSSDFDTQDAAITASLQQVGSRAENSFSSRDFLTLKAAIDGTESDGTYSHTVTVIYVGDY